MCHNFFTSQLSKGVAHYCPYCRKTIVIKNEIDNVYIQGQGYFIKEIKLNNTETKDLMKYVFRRIKNVTPTKKELNKKSEE